MNGSQKIEAFLLAAASARREKGAKWKKDDAIAMCNAAAALFQVCGDVIQLNSYLPIYNALFLGSGLDRFSDNPPTGEQDILSLDRQMPETIALLLLGKLTHPWADERFSNAIALAIHMGCASFVQQALLLPSAPPAEDFFARKVSKASNVLGLMSGSVNGVVVLSRISPMFAKSLPTNKVFTALCTAHPRALSPLIGMAESALTPTQIKRVKDSWSLRLRTDPSLSRHIQDMIKQLDPSKTSIASNEEAKSIVESGLVGSLLSCSWYDVHKREPDILVHNVTIHPHQLGEVSRQLTGKLAGNWNVLAALFMRQIKATSKNGTPSFSLRYVIGTSPGEWNEGSLSSVLGVEWKNGISLDGVFFLALASSKGYNAIVEKEASNNERDFFFLTGINENKDEWVRQAVNHAYEFTRSIIPKNSVNSATAMANCWMAALHNSSVAKDEVRSWGFNKRLDLMMALTGGFSIPPQLLGSRGAVFQNLREVLFSDARQYRSLLKEKDFDHPSMAPVLTYELMSTDLYNLRKVVKNPSETKIYNHHQEELVFEYMNSAMENEAGRVGADVVRVIDIWSKVILGIEKDQGINGFLDWGIQLQTWCKANKLAYLVEAKKDRKEGSKPKM